jgi:hypothetical protein
MDRMSIRTARPGKPDFDQKVRLGILAATLAFREISPARDDPVPDPESLMWKPIQLLNGRADACRHLVAVKLKLADVLGRSSFTKLATTTRTIRRTEAPYRRGVFPKS